MTRQHIIFNAIVYIILTTFLIYLCINGKKIGEKIDSTLDKFCDNIIQYFSSKNENEIKNESAGAWLKKSVKFIESLISALILVLIIQKFYIGNFVVPTGSMLPTIQLKDRFFGNMVVYKFKVPDREDIIVFREPIENKSYYTKRIMGFPGEKIRIENERLIVNGKVVSARKYTDRGNMRGLEWKIPKKGDTITIIPPATKINEIKGIDVAKFQEQMVQNISDKYTPEYPTFLVNGELTGPILDYIHDKKIIEELNQGRQVNIILDEDCYFALGDNTEESFDSRYWGLIKESRIKGKIMVRFWPLNRIGVVK